MKTRPSLSSKRNRKPQGGMDPLSKQNGKRRRGYVPSRPASKSVSGSVSGSEVRKRKKKLNSGHTLYAHFSC